MPARFGPGGNCEDFYAAGNKSTVQVFKWLKDKGLELYEYQGGKGLKGSSTTLESFRSEALEHNITLSLHAPYYIAIASGDEEKRLNSVGYIVQSLKFANDIGARKIIIHPGGLGKLTRPEAMELAKRTLEAAANAAYENKMESIKIGIETMGKENLLGTIEEVIELCKIDNIYVPVVDFGHLYARSLGCDMQQVDDYMRIFELIDKELGAETVNGLHCHFSKIEYTEKGEKKHLKFADEGFGPHYEPFMESVAKADISPDVICESAGTMTSDAQILKDRYFYFRSVL